MKALLVTGLLATLFGWGTPLPADPIEITAQFLRPDGSPMAGQDIRIVVGTEPHARASDAGRILTTDDEGYAVYSVVAPITARSITLDTFFVRHPAHLIEVGIELDLLGRRALYWIELDLVKGAGPVAGMTAYVQDDEDNFSRALAFDSARHSWRFPDQKGGMLLSGIGAKIRDHAMSGAPGEPWTIDLVIEKSEFTMR